MNTNTELSGISEKVKNNERLNKEDGIKLLNSDDLLTIGELANHKREQINKNFAYFINNLNINPTNICENRCELCAFSRNANDSDAYFMSLKDIEKRVDFAAENNIFDIHIVGGLNENTTLNYYEEMFSRIKSKFPDIYIQALTAVEIDYISKIEGTSVSEVLKRLKKAGLDSLPGGGAEIFNEKIRVKICSKKISGKRWLEVMRIAHESGIKSNATILYGHIESYSDRIEHLLKLRKLQDETSGFLALVPLAFYPLNTKFSKIPATTGYDDLKMIAVSRLMLDNFPHIKLLWPTLGEKLSQISLQFGTDDFGGTSFDEKIVHEAGAKVQDYISKEKIINLIKKAGRVPLEVNSGYCEIA